jgi:hypothetical protein
VDVLALLHIPSNKVCSTPPHPALPRVVNHQQPCGLTQMLLWLQYPCRTGSITSAAQMQVGRFILQQVPLCASSPTYGCRAHSERLRLLSALLSRRTTRSGDSRAAVTCCCPTTSAPASAHSHFTAWGEVSTTSRSQEGRHWMEETLAWLTDTQQPGHDGVYMVCTQSYTVAGDSRGVAIQVSSVTNLTLQMHGRVTTAKSIQFASSLRVLSCAGWQQLCSQITSAGHVNENTWRQSNLPCK